MTVQGPAITIGRICSDGARALRCHSRSAPASTRACWSSAAAFARTPKARTGHPWRHNAVDEVDRLIHAFRARGGSSTGARLDVLMDLERLTDCRVVPFLLGVLNDRREAVQVRSHVLKQLRNGRLTATTRPLVAEALLRILSDGGFPQLRLESAVALGEFVDLDGVPAALGDMTLDVTQPIDLRYSAFTSLERSGPTTECIAVLRRLATDEVLGRSALSVLSTWHLA